MKQNKSGKLSENASETTKRYVTPVASFTVFDEDAVRCSNGGGDEYEDKTWLDYPWKNVE